MIDALIEAAVRDIERARRDAARAAAADAAARVRAEAAVKVESWNCLDCTLSGLLREEAMRHAERYDHRLREYQTDRGMWSSDAGGVYFADRETLRRNR